MLSPLLRLLFLLAGVWSQAMFALAQSAPAVKSVVITPGQPAPAAKPAAEKYTVKFTAPDKVGQTYRLFVKQNESINAKISVISNAMKDERQNSASELIAVATVLKLSPRGSVQKQTFQIEKFVKLNGSLAQPILPAGTLVTAVVETGALRFYVKGRRVSEALHKALHDVIPMDDDDTLDMEAFEPATPKAVGESWPMNVQAAIAGLRREKITVAPQHIRGAVKLDRVMTVGAEKYLSVSSTMQAHSFSMPVPPGAKLISNDLRVSSVSKLPVISGHLPPEETYKMTIAIVMQVKQNAASPTITIDTTMERNVTARMEELSKTIASAAK